MSKIKRTQMKKFSDDLNYCFSTLNKLVNTEVFQSSVSKDGYLELHILGRDAVFNNELGWIDTGMYIPNDLLNALETGINIQLKTKNQSENQEC